MFGYYWSFHEFKDPEFNAVAAACSDFEANGTCPDEETEVFLVEQVEDFEGTPLSGAAYRPDCQDGLCPPSGVVGPFVLLASPGASDAIVIGGGTQVFKGDVGTDGSLKIGSNVKIDGEGNAVNTSRTIAQTMVLGGGSQFDALYAGTLPSVGSNVKLGEPRAAYNSANVQTFAAGNLPDPDNWPSAPRGPCTPGAANADVITGSNTADFNLAVGQYDTITLGGGSTVSLIGGRYQVREFITGSNVKIHVAQGTTVCVTEKLIIGGGTRVNDPVFGAGNFVQEKDFVIEYTGTGSVTTGSNVAFFGGILAFPNGSLIFGGGGTYTGAYIAKSIITGSNVKLTLSNPSPF
jgi:hypothetical protein